MASASSQALRIEQFVCGTPRQERQWARLPDTRIGSGLWHSRQMASASSQARRIEQFVCGSSQVDGQRQTHLLDTWTRSDLWHSPKMTSALSHQNADQFAR